MDDRSKVFSQFLQKAHGRQESDPEPEVVRPEAEPAAPTSTQNKTAMPSAKRLILSATSKGGVGKSYVTVNLIEWLRSIEAPFIAFDPDWCNSTLTRFYEEAEFIDISEEVHLDNVIRAFERSDLVVADGVGSLQMKFIDWLEETRVFEMREELGLEITLVVIIEEDKETVFQAGQAAKRVGNNANWLVVRNLKTSPVTEIYDGSNARKELLALGAREITIERLPWNLNSMLQKSSKSIGGLIDDDSVFFLERQRLRSYQQRLFEEFAGARDILLPESQIHLAAPTPPPVAEPELAVESAPEPEPETEAADAASQQSAAAPVGAPARPRIPPKDV
ncbi:MAG: hypothetical protein WA771_06765 [Chthoniobacterales bacterium]